MKALFQLVSVEINPKRTGEYRVVFPNGTSGMYRYSAKNDMWTNGEGEDWFLGEGAKYYNPISPTIKELVKAAQEIDEYLSVEAFERGKPVYRNNVGAFSILHKNLSAALDKHRKK